MGSLHGRAIRLPVPRKSYVLRGAWEGSALWWLTHESVTTHQLALLMSYRIVCARIVANIDGVLPSSDIVLFISN